MSTYTEVSQGAVRRALTSAGAEVVTLYSVPQWEDGTGEVWAAAAELHASMLPSLLGALDRAGRSEMAWAAVTVQEGERLMIAFPGFRWASDGTIEDQ